MKKTIVVFSNPFGYGPAGKAIAIAEAFIKKGYLDITFVGSALMREIVPTNVNYIEVNERDEVAIKTVLATITNPVVVSSQNRFAIRAAVSLGIPCAFLDGLSWLWNEIPADHLIANEIFWMKFPEIEKKMPAFKNVHIVPAIVNLVDIKEKKDFVLVHIGGCVNPLTDDFPYDYLFVLAEALNCKFTFRIKVAGSTKAIEYLKTLVMNDAVELVTLRHEQFVQVLSEASHFVTTPGQTATLEAFESETPVSFLLPMNLSQSMLINILSKFNAAPSSLHWKNYLQSNFDLHGLNEKEVITMIIGISKNIKEDKNARQQIKRDLVHLINHVPSIVGQRKFIDSVGVQGADFMVDYLIKKWNLIL